MLQNRYFISRIFSAAETANWPDMEILLTAKTLESITLP